MHHLNSQQKKEVLAHITAFNYSGFEYKLTANVCYHHQSFVGGDYKVWAQMGVFILGPYLNNGDKEVWLSLSQVPIMIFIIM